MRKKASLLLAAALLVTGIFTPIAGKTSAEAASPTPTEYIMVGDSRTVQMARAVDAVTHTNETYSGYRTACANKKGKSAYWSAKGGEGYEWMVNVGVPRIEKRIKKNTAVIIWMGGNSASMHDYYAPKYVSYLLQKTKAWTAKGARVYYASIGLCHKSKTKANNSIRTFDDKIKKGLSGSECRYIDLNPLTSKWDWSYYASDGDHFADKGSKSAWNVIKSEVQKDFKNNSARVKTGGPTVANGVYLLKSAINQGYALDVAGGSSANGTKIQLWQTNGSNAQRFRIEQIGSTGYYKITNIGSKKVVDVRQGQFTQRNNIQIWPYNGSLAQQWVLKKNANGSFTLMTKANGLVVDVSDGRVSKGQKIWLWPENGSKAQQFFLQKVG